MKVYVRGYGPEAREEHETEEPETAARFDNWQTTLVEYSAAPELVMPGKAEAEGDCALLNSLDVRVKDHCCKFEVEELAGGFAVVCVNHPPLRPYGAAHATNAPLQG